MRMLSRPWAFFWVLSATFNGAFGKGFEFELSRQNPVSQKDYESLTSGLSKTFGYSWMSPASPTGLVGFDVGIGAAFMIRNALDLATVSSSAGSRRISS